MTPLQLYYILREILVEECGCRASWEQHRQPLGAAELAAIKLRILEALEVQSSRVQLNRVSVSHG